MKLTKEQKLKKLNEQINALTKERDALQKEINDAKEQEQKEKFEKAFKMAKLMCSKSELSIDDYVKFMGDRTAIEDFKRRIKDFE